MTPYDGGVIEDSLKTIERERNISMNSRTSLRDYIDDGSEQLKTYYEYLRLNTNLNTYPYGFYISQILLACEFQGQKCSYEDFYWYYDYHYGNCFRFNGGSDLKNQSRSDNDKDVIEKSSREICLFSRK